MPFLGSQPAETALSTGNLGDDIVTEAKINLISTSSVPSVEAKGDGSSDGYIQLNCSQNSHGIKLKSPPHSAAQSYTLTYPSSVVDGGFMKTDSSGNLSFAVVGGKILQVKSYTVRTVVTGSTDMPNDNTIPQNSEGTEIITGAITPASATNKLLFLVNLQASINAATWGVAGLFQDSTAGALAASYAYCPANGGGAHIAFTHYMDAGTTSSTTFKLRAGAQSGSNTITINGNAGNQTMGGVAHTGFQIWEIQV